MSVNSSKVFILGRFSGCIVLHVILLAASIVSIEFPHIYDTNYRKSICDEKFRFCNTYCVCRHLFLKYTVPVRLVLLKVPQIFFCNQLLSLQWYISRLSNSAELELWKTVSVGSYTVRAGGAITVLQEQDRIGETFTCTLP